MECDLKMNFLLPVIQDIKVFHNFVPVTPGNNIIKVITFCKKFLKCRLGMLPVCFNLLHNGNPLVVTQGLLVCHTKV